MALLTLGLRLSTYVTVYFLMATLNADIVCGFLGRVFKMEGVTRTDATVKTTEDNLYSMEIHRGGKAKEYCDKKTDSKYNGYKGLYYVELFYQNTLLDSFCCNYDDFMLEISVMYYCHAENVHVFHIDYVIPFDLMCKTVRYSPDNTLVPIEEVSCWADRAYALQGQCLSSNGWDDTKVRKALRFSIFKKPWNNKPLGGKKWKPKQ